VWWRVYMDGLLSVGANVAQLLGLNSWKSVFAVVTLTFLWQASGQLWAWMGWKSVPLAGGYRLIVLLALSAVSLGFWIYFITRPENLVRNADFREGTKYWGTGYVETLVT